MVEEYFNSFSSTSGDTMQDESLFVGTTVGMLLDQAAHWQDDAPPDVESARRDALEERFGPVS
jgi:hypothetical protein